MSIFDSILDKLGMKKGQPAAPAAAQTPAAPMVQTPSMLHANPPSTPAAAPSSAPVEMAKVDLVTHLDYLAKTGPIKGLNWRVSINDFMALLGMDHSPEAIKNLAIELGCPEKEMMDSYSRNVWTHAALMKKLAANGGKLPPELLK